MDIISILIGLILGASFGGVLAYIFIKKIQHAKEKEIIEKAHIQGENIKKDKIIQAKEKFLELKEQHEKTINSRERKIQDKEFQFKQRENRMKYRSSNCQNLLQRSREVANLCTTMASELGLNPKAAKRAGLLHDIGKVPVNEPELPHAIFGMKFAEKCGEKKDICNAIRAHHDEIEMTTMISPVVQICDAVSGARPGARPGARREMVEAYIQRIKELENTALSFDGVTNAYAIQAGRELRVLVESEKIGNKRVDELAFEISEKIESEMTYPGQVKITVVREKRAVSYAK